MSETSRASLLLKARLTGVFFLLNILTGIYAQGFIANRLVTTDPATTAANVLAHPGQLELAFAIFMVEMACQVVVTVLFYDLLKPVSRVGSLTAAMLSIVGIAIKTAGRLFFVAPLLVLGDAPSVGAFGPEERRALALLFFHFSDRAAEIGLVFFGFANLPRGYLIYRSTFWPRAIGVLSLLGGLGWMTFLYPPLAYRLFPILVAVGLLGSLVTIVWLQWKGVNVERWKEMARAAPQALQ